MEMVLAYGLKKTMRWRAGLIIFLNQCDTLRRLRVPRARFDGVCQLQGRATIVIRDLETVCPGQEATDRALLVKVISTSSPTRNLCDAATQ